jgi:RNA polymerase sigma-70 factor (sigma-E family)
VELEEYVAARGPALLRLAHVLCGDGHRAQDLVQTALVDAYRHWRRVQRADHPDAYVRRILVNAHLAAVRKRSSGEVPVSEVPEPDGAGPDGADPADGVTGRDGFRAALDGLPPRARTVLVLRYWCDLDDVAIADAMGVSPVTVRATASRALATLRERAAAPEATTTTSGEAP